MLHQIAQGLALALAGAALGWTALFSFVVAPLAYDKLDQGRAKRHVGDIIKRGHTILAIITAIAAAAALASGAIAAAALAALSATFTLMCRWLLAPRSDDSEAPGRRVYKTARVLANALTAFLMPIHIGVIVLAGLGV